MTAWLPLHSSLRHLKDAVAAARADSLADAKAAGAWVRSRGTFLGTTVNGAQGGPHPSADCHEWDGSKGELDRLIAELKATHPEVEELWLVGGHDAADTKQDLFDHDNYEPWAGSGEVLVGVNPDHQRHAFRTFMGLPPDSGDEPVCGASITRAYRGHLVCPACDAVVAASKA